MKKIDLKLISALLIFQVTFLPASVSLQENAKLEPDSNHPRIEQVISYLLSRSHYQKKEIDDSLSSEFYSNYVESLDGNKSYFLAQDISSFEAFKYELDDSIRAGSVGPAYQIFNVFIQRFRQRMDYVQKRLDQGFDFAKDEFYQPDRREDSWAISAKELDEIWRKRIKNDALKLKLAGKEWEDI